MFQNNRLASTFSRKISTAARHTIEDMASGRAQQEPSITDRLIAYIQAEARANARSSFAWTAMTLTDRGRGSQEKKYGADFVGSLEIRISGFNIKKGFLAQAKKVEPTDTFTNSDYAKLKSQCEDMLRLSPDSFVFLYSMIDGFSVLPAISILGARNCNPHELTKKPIQKFFTEHFECFIGDSNISLANIETLDQLYEAYRARAGIHITIGKGDTEEPLQREGKF